MKSHSNTERMKVALGMARLAATLSTCPRRAVGCVLVDPDTYNTYATGYNGSARRASHCNEIGCLLVDVGGRLSCQRTVHAEMNAILSAARAGRTTKGAIAISTTRPCEKCAMAMYQAGIIACWYDEPYDGPEGLVDELRKVGWSCEKLH